MSRSKDSGNENDEDEEGKETQETRQGAGKDVGCSSFSRISKTCMYDKKAPFYTGRFNLRIPHSSGYLLIHSLTN